MFQKNAREVEVKRSSKNCSSWLIHTNEYLGVENAYVIVIIGARIKNVIFSKSIRKMNTAQRLQSIAR